MVNAPPLPLVLGAAFGQSRKLWPTSPQLQPRLVRGAAATSTTAAAATQSQSRDRKTASPQLQQVRETRAALSPERAWGSREM